MGTNRFTNLIGCTLPVQLAAMGGVGTTDLAAAVASAGGLGMVPAGTQPAAGICGVNFLMPFNPSLEEIAAASRGCRVVEFFYGDPRAEVLSEAHRAGAMAGWQVGSAAEAVEAERAGCDYLVAQGVEAGGHVRGNQGLDDLLAQVLASVRIPVVAGGGIATAERTSAVIRAGADAVRVGTRFVASPESGAHPEYVRMVLAAGADATVLTEWFGEGWPNAPHRVLRSCLATVQQTGWRATTPPSSATLATCPCMRVRVSPMSSSASRLPRLSQTWSGCSESGARSATLGAPFGPRMAGKGGFIRAVRGPNGV